MRFVKPLSALVCLGILTACAAPLALAQEDPPNLADAWVMRPKAGQESDFEKKFKEHITFRKSKGDVRNWTVWTPVTGDDLNRYIVRSCCHEWKDQDAYREWTMKNGLLEHWNANVAPHVEAYEHHFYELDTENSNWTSTAPPAYVGVTMLEPKMGKSPMIADHVSKLSTAAKEMSWPYEWAWTRRVGGGPHLAIVIPYASYAAMEAPEKSFAEALGEKIGKDEAGKVLAAWADNFKTSYYTIYALHREMSMMPASEGGN